MLKKSKNGFNLMILEFNHLIFQKLEIQLLEVNININLLIQNFKNHQTLIF